MQTPHRPFSFWLKQSPPGWISNRRAESADPVALAGEIHCRLRGFIRWLRQPEPERWDTHALQSLSAALFNRYRTGRTEKSLLELDWPSGSDEIRACLSGLQLTLAAPLAVFKAVRLPAAESHPTPEELRLAEAALTARLTILEELAARLNVAIEHYLAASHARVQVFASEKAQVPTPDVFGSISKEATAGASRSDR